MAKKENPNKVSLRILRGVCLTFFVVGAFFVAGGVWTTSKFDSCARTIVCDNDVLPPSIMVAAGGVSLIVSLMYWRVVRLIVNDDNTAVRDPRFSIGVCLLGSGLSFMVLCVQQRFNGADLSYYEWMARQGTKTFVVDLVTSFLIICTGAWMTRRYYTLFVASGKTSEE